MKKEETKKSTKKTKKEKLKIVREASIHGVRETLDIYGVYPTTYYSWKRKFEEMGAEGFGHGMTKERLQKIKELEQEVDLLKQLTSPKAF